MQFLHRRCVASKRGALAPRSFPTPSATLTLGVFTVPALFYNHAVDLQCGSGLPMIFRHRLVVVSSRPQPGDFGFD